MWIFKQNAFLAGESAGSGFAELLEGLEAFYASAVGENPSGIALDVIGFASCSIVIGSVGIAFDVRQEVFGVAKEFFLVGAVRTPEGSVELSPTIGNALCKGIVGDVSVATSDEERESSKKDGEFFHGLRR